MFLSLKQAAQRTGLSPIAVRQRCRTRGIGQLINRRFFIHVDDLAKVARSNGWEQPADPSPAEIRQRCDEVLRMRDHAARPEREQRSRQQRLILRVIRTRPGIHGATIIKLTGLAVTLVRRELNALINEGHVETSTDTLPRYSIAEDPANAVVESADAILDRFRRRAVVA